MVRREPVEPLADRVELAAVGEVVEPAAQLVERMVRREPVEPLADRVELATVGEVVEPSAQLVERMVRSQAVEPLGQRVDDGAQGVELLAAGDGAPGLGELAPQRLQLVARGDVLAERVERLADGVEVALGGPAVGERRELLADRLEVGAADAAVAQGVERAVELVEVAAGDGPLAQVVERPAQLVELGVGAGLADGVEVAPQLVDVVALGEAVDAAAEVVQLRVRAGVAQGVELPAQVVERGVGAGVAQRGDLALQVRDRVGAGQGVEPLLERVGVGGGRADGGKLGAQRGQLVLPRRRAAQLVERGAQLLQLRAVLRLRAREDVQALADDRHLLARVGLLRLDRVELVLERRQVDVRCARGLQPGELGAQRADLLPGAVVGLADGGELGVQRLARLGLPRAHAVELGAQRARGLGVADGLLAQLVGERAQGVEPGARRLGVALQLLQAAAIVAGERLAFDALDRDLPHALAQPLGVALDGVDALERGGQVGARGLELAVVLALDALEGGAQLLAGGVGLLALALEPLQRGAELLLGGLGVAGALGAERLELGLEAAADGVGSLGARRLQRLEAAIQLGARLGGLLQRGGVAGLGAGAGLEPLLLEPLEPLDQRGAGHAAVLAALGGGLLELLEPGDELGAVGVRRGGGRVAGGDGQPLQLGAGAAGLLLGGLGAGGAGLRLAAGLLDLGGQLAGDALQLVDPLERGQQPGHDRGGVVEIVDRPLDAGIGVGDGLLALGVLARALLLAAGELVLDPRRGRERAEGDERAGGPPALPGLRLGVERRAEGAHDDRVLLAHAQQHQVHRQLERQVLEEEREVEALVELDRDEDGLEREGLLRRRVAGGDLDERAGVRRVAGGEEAAPLLGVGAQRAGQQAVEERVAERVGGLLAEQQLGGLGPLRDGALAVGEDEPAADDLLEQRVERIVRRNFGRVGLRRRRRSGRRGLERAGGLIRK